MKKVLFAVSCLILLGNLSYATVIVKGNYVTKTIAKPDGAPFTYGVCNTDPVENCETTYSYSEALGKTVFTYKNLLSGESSSFSVPGQHDPAEFENLIKSGIANPL